MTLGELLAVASRAMNDQFNDENGALTWPHKDTDPEAHDRSLRVVRRAFRRVIGSKPDWNWMGQTVEIELEAGTAEYDMPWYFTGQVLGPMTFTSTGAPMLSVTLVSPAQVEASRAGTGRDHSADPQIGAFVRKDRDNLSDPSEWKVVFWPTPSTARTVAVRIRAEPENISDAGHRFVAGSEYNRLVECAVLYEAAIEANPERREVYAGEYQSALRDAIEQDNRSKARTAGTISRTMGRPQYPGHRVTGFSVNGTPVW